MVELVEDEQGICPGPFGTLGVTRAELDVAEVIERVGFVEAVREFPVEADGSLVAGDRSLVLAELVMDVAEAVPGGGLPVALAHRPDGVKRLLAGRDGLLVIAEQGLTEADVVEGLRLARQVLCRTEKLEGTQGVAECVRGTLLPFGKPGEADVNSCLADAVADGLELPQGVLEVRVGVVEAAGPGVAQGETVPGVGLPGHVAYPAGGGQRGVLGPGVVRPGSAADEGRAQHPGELPCAGAVARVGGELDSSEQHGVLGAEPGHRALGRAGLARADPRLSWRHGGRLEVRIDQHRCVPGGVQVVVEEAMHGRVPDLLAVVRLGLLGGIGAEQVVEGVAAGRLLGEQVRAGQLGQRRAGPVRLDRGEAGRGGEADVRPRVQAQQPEQPRRGGAQRAVGPREHRADVGGQVTPIEGIERAGRLAQLGGEDSQREAGAGRGAGGGDGQGQRQPRAAGDDVIDRCWLAGHPA